MRAPSVCFRGTQVKSLCVAAARGLADLAFPRVCLLCERLMNEQRGLVCEACWANVSLLPTPQCARCGHPTYARDCRWCVLLPAFVHGARSMCWVPEGVGGEVVHKFKYSAWTDLAGAMAERMAGARLPPTGLSSVMVPVPLGAARYKERGFNQSAVLARALGRRWQMPVAEQALVRHRETESQVRLTPEERSANVHCAFGAGPASNVGSSIMDGKHVVLVDDVVTTAATLNACATAAVAAGAQTISYVTFGRARAAFDQRAHPRSEPRWLSASASTASAG